MKLAYITKNYAQELGFFQKEFKCHLRNNYLYFYKLQDNNHNQNTRLNFIENSYNITIFNQYVIITPDKLLVTFKNKFKIT